jgi:AcrR family transcriptional regulator
MHDIGERVGMLKGSLYVHVANKEEMLLEIVSTTSRQFIDALTPILSDAGPAPGRIRTGVQAHLNVILSNPNGARVFLHEGRHLDGQPGRWVKEAHDRYERVWQRAFLDGIASGEFRPDLDASAATLLAISVGSWPAVRHFQGGASIGELANRFSDVILAGCIVA